MALVRWPWVVALAIASVLPAFSSSPVDAGAPAEPLRLESPTPSATFAPGAIEVRWRGPLPPANGGAAYVVETNRYFVGVGAVFPGPWIALPRPYACEPAPDTLTSAVCSASWNPPEGLFGVRVRPAAGSSCVQTGSPDAVACHVVFPVYVDGTPPSAQPPCVVVGTSCAPPGTTLASARLAVRGGATDNVALEDVGVRVTGPLGDEACPMQLHAWNGQFTGECLVDVAALLVPQLDGSLAGTITVVTEATDRLGLAHASTGVSYDVAVPPSAPTPSGFSNTSVFPGNYDPAGFFSEPAFAGPLDALPGDVLYVPSEYDGELIQIGVVRPDTTDPVPIIVFASPYFAPLTPQNLALYGTPFVANYVPHGYAVALVPVRGTADHGGCMDLMGPAERADLDQAITWLATRAWSNGNVGMVGVSYDGSTPWEVAAAGNPHLKTIVPISGVNDLYNLMFQNGSAEWRGGGAIEALYYTYGFVEYNPSNGRSVEHTIDGVVCPESWKALAAGAESSTTGERDAAGFWDARNSRPGVEANYDGSIFLVQGLQDWNVDPHHSYPWVADLEDRGFVVKHLLGQWGHAWPDIWSAEVERRDWAEILLHWFDYWLKEDTTVDLGPRAQVQDSSFQWRNEASWPPRDATWTKFHLNADRGLDAAPEPAAASLFSVATGHPLVTSTVCVVCPSFATEPVAGELRFSGIPRVHLTVTPTGPGGHVAATLYARDAIGARTFLGWGQMDLRFAAGGEEAQPVVPGQPLLAKMVLEPLDAVVPAGSRLELVLHQGFYGDHVPPFPTYPVRFEVGGGLSALSLPVIERDGSTFFAPPPAE